jgi:hypothetical protein
MSAAANEKSRFAASIMKAVLGALTHQSRQRS